MVCALWIARSDTEYLTNFLYGTEREVMDALIENAAMLMDAVGNGMSIEELQKEYYCKFDDYLKYRDDSVPVTIEDLKRYDFVLSDCTDYLQLVTDDLSEFVKLFNEDPPFPDIIINPDVTENDLESLAGDFESYASNYEEYDWLIDLNQQDDE